MAHHVYQTEALVLRGASSGESDRFVDVFTRELGFVRAVAQSARKERSKMRYSLQDHTHLDISLVRGRLVWRITGTREIQNFYYAFEDEPQKRILLGKINNLLRRLLHGEEKNEALFESVLAFFLFLLRESVKEKDVRNIECLIVLRILYHLGYVGKKDGLFETNDFDEGLLRSVAKDQKAIIKEINTALQESQL